MVLLNKKGQSEVIGLVVIVLILIVVGLIFLRFYLTNESNNKESVSNIKANNLVSAIKQASVCNGDMVDVIVSCCSNKEFCGRDSCQLANDEIRKITEKSLEERVYFEAKQENSLCFSINEDCQGISSTENLIRNEEDEAKIRVKICY